MTDFKMQDEFKSNFQLNGLRVMVCDAPNDLAVEGQAFFHLTPEQARKLAAELLANADKASK